MWANLVLCLAAVTIDGPAAVEAGDLAVFTADIPGGRWVIVPSEWEPRFVAVTLADGRSAVVFASRRPGTITLVYAVCGSDGLEIARHQFENKAGTDPPPAPPPTPPNPEPNPPPLPKPPYRLIWIEESSDRTPEQAAAQNDRAIRDALTRAGWTLRVVDKDVKDEYGRTPADLKPFIDDAISRGLPRLYFVGSDGRSVSLPAPANRDRFIQILREFGLVIQPAPSSTSPAAARPLPAPRGVCVGGSCLLVP